MCDAKNYVMLAGKIGGFTRYGFPNKSVITVEAQPLEHWTLKNSVEGNEGKMESGAVTLKYENAGFVANGTLGTCGGFEVHGQTPKLFGMSSSARYNGCLTKKEKCSHEASPMGHVEYGNKYLNITLDGELTKNFIKNHKLGVVVEPCDHFSAGIQFSKKQKEKDEVHDIEGVISAHCEKGGMLAANVLNRGEDVKMSVNHPIPHTGVLLGAEAQFSVQKVWKDKIYKPENFAIGAEANLQVHTIPTTVKAKYGSERKLIFSVSQKIGEYMTLCSSSSYDIDERKSKIDFEIHVFE